MRVAFLATAGVAFLFSPIAAADDAVKEEMKKFQGTWQLVTAETDGNKLDAKTAAKIHVVIEGGKHTVYFGDDVVAKAIPMTLDPSKKPKEATDTLPDGTEIKGIYELDGDTLKSCTSEAGKARPKEFSAKAGSGQTLRVFKRVKS